MRIGCLFGSFDPPHRGHLAIAEHMLASCELEQVWLVVTPQNPFKQDRTLGPDQHRLAMVRLAVQGRMLWWPAASNWTCRAPATRRIASASCATAGPITSSP
ncbi:MAG: adenylyltransferase/cytidyltransferase family protein [Flavobacteriales bacterium]